jgi:hypothetical protein
MTSAVTLLCTSRKTLDSVVVAETHRRKTPKK